MRPVPGMVKAVHRKMASGIFDDSGGRSTRHWVAVLAKYRLELNAMAKGELGALSFPPRLETEFRRFARRNAWFGRFWTVAVTGVLSLLAPLWIQPVLGLPVAVATSAYAMDFHFIGPMFLALALVLFLWPAAALTEWLYMIAWTIEAAGIEAWRYLAEQNHFVVSAYLSLSVPLAVISIGRLSFTRSCGFSLIYLLIITIKHLYFSLSETPHLETDFLALAVVIFSSLIASAFAQRSLRQVWALLQLSKLSTWSDHLTSIPNRRMLEEHFERSHKAPAGNRHFQVLAIIDLDHFKLINDRYGHAAGDEVLVRVAACIAKYSYGSSDIAARIGGEEFALLLGNYHPDLIEAHLNQLRAEVAALAIPNAGSQYGVATMSIGAVVTDQRLPLSQIYRRADAKLYEAKAAGRNRVLVETLVGDTGIAEPRP